MHLIIFSVYDSKAESYVQPFYVPRVNVGIRMFAHAANNTETDFGRFPGDYTLFQIGTFDSDTGQITPDKAHTNHGTALSHLAPNWKELPIADLAEATEQTIAEIRRETKTNQDTLSEAN